jgi:hypothetical protein
MARPGLVRKIAREIRQFNWRQPPSRHIEDRRKFDPTKVLMDTSLQQLEE